MDCYVLTKNQFAEKYIFIKKLNSYVINEHLYFWGLIHSIDLMYVVLLNAKKRYVFKYNLFYLFKKQL